jgi:16S rRNA (cytidine1402-2'-O)-methyltransferase
VIENSGPAGHLLLVPNALHSPTERNETIDLTEVLPLGTLRAAARVRFWAAENAKATRAFLKRVDSVVKLAVPMQQQSIVELPRTSKGGTAPVDSNAFDELLAPARAGHDVGLHCEAGLPAVADPGSALVAHAHETGIGVQVLSGPSAITLALAASGLNGQNFAFVGYLPVESTARARRIRELEAISRRAGQTHLVIETPYRNRALLSALTSTLAPSTRLSVSVGLLLPNGWTHTRSVACWRASPSKLPTDVPCVFAWLAR